MPDPINPTAGSTTTAQTTSQGDSSSISSAPAPAVGTSQSPATVSGPAATQMAGSQAGSSPTPAPAYTSVRDALRSMGVNLGENVADDRAALEHLVGAYRRNGDLQQLAQHGQVYLQHADRFQAYLASQRDEEARKQQQAQASWWKAPEYDPSWASKLVRDANGNIQVLPGNDPSILPKFMAWAEHQRSFMDKFAQDPIAAIKPGIEQLVREQAQQMIQQHLGQYSQQQQAQALLAQHADWLYEQDASTGQRKLSEWGNRYAGYVQEAHNMNITDPARQDRYARSMVQRDYLLTRQGQADQQASQQTQAQQAQAQGDAQKAQFLANAALRRSNVGANGAAGVNGAPTNPPPMSTPRDLAAIMLKNMQANGFQPGQVITDR